MKRDAAADLALCQAATDPPMITARYCDEDNTWHEMQVPAVCPVTGDPFFMVCHHPELGDVPTYGGSYDSYTIPEMDEDGSWYRERCDHDMGEWVEGSEALCDQDIAHWCKAQQANAALISASREALPFWIEEAQRLRGMVAYALDGPDACLRTILVDALDGVNGAENVGDVRGERKRLRSLLQQAKDRLTDVESLHSLHSRQEVCIDSRSVGGALFGIRVAKDKWAKEWQAADEEAETIRQQARLLVADIDAALSQEPTP